MNYLSKCGSRRWSLRIFAGVAALLALLYLVGSAHADTNAQVAATLTTADTYLSPVMPPSAHVVAGDTQRLADASSAANKSGVAEKIALVSHFPARKYANTYAAAEGLRQFLDFSGVLVMVSPRGIGVASDTLTLNEIRSIETKARPRCLVSYAACAVFAGQLAVTQVKADRSSANKSAAVFWLVLLAILAVIIAVVVFFVRRRRGVAAANLGELRTAAGNTLGLADTAVQEIESAKRPMENDVRAEYDRALALRDKASVGLQNGKSAAALSQANHDAATAVLALQGVTKHLGLAGTFENPLQNTSEHRCFYCGRTDRPPYVQRTIDDSKGNSMEIEVCSVDLQTLERGRTPQMQTVQYNGTTVPWWAVPTSPWYYGYGGPTWQYWLPFMIGMDAGAWYGGGWGAPGYAYGGNWGGYDNDSGAGYSGGELAGSTVDPSTDYGAGDFSGWGDTGGGSSGGDTGGWGGDSGGGGDWGGGGDSGGGDSGGW